MGSLIKSKKCDFYEKIMFYLITKYAKDNKDKKIFVLLRVLRSEKIIPQNARN